MTGKGNIIPKEAMIARHNISSLQLEKRVFTSAE
jgi:hypothetical protein